MVGRVDLESKNSPTQRVAHSMLDDTVAMRKHFVSDLPNTVCIFHVAIVHRQVLPASALADPRQTGRRHDRDVDQGAAPHHRVAVDRLIRSNPCVPRSAWGQEAAAIQAIAVRQAMRWADDANFAIPFRLACAQQFNQRFKDLGAGPGIGVDEPNPVVPVCAGELDSGREPAA